MNFQLSFDSDNTRHKSFELPGARPHYNPDRPGQVEHIFLDLALDIPNQSVVGTCTITLSPVRSGIDRLTLDAVNLNIHSVEVDESPQTFDYDGNELHIQMQTPTEMGKSVKVAIAYSVEKPNAASTSSPPTNIIPTNRRKSGRKEKMKTPASGFPALIIRDSWQLQKFASKFPNL
jgi:aminopeptidase N